MLEQQIDRGLINQVKDDSSSLTVLWDSASYLTSSGDITCSSSSWSSDFIFDSELLTSSVYKRAIRSAFRAPFRHAGLATRATTLSPKDLKSTSRNID